MATDLGKANTSRATAGAKHDTFIQTQLARAERRIRALDIGVALCGFAALGCVAVAALAVADHAWSLPEWARQVGLAAIVLGGAAYLYVALARPLLYRVNPYYAAQVVEHTLPEAKNSVVTWLDLQQQQLPPAIRMAVGQKAAKDLSKTDVEGAFSTRRVLWAGGVAAVCAVLFLVCFARVGSGAFFRVLAPFTFSSPEAPTRITLLKPANGDDTVIMTQAVTIAAHIDGKMPDPNGPNAVRVLYHHQLGDPYKTALATQLDNNDFTTIIQPIDVQGGFWYKVVAGDAETLEYRIDVRTHPLLTRVHAAYHYRAYLGRSDEHHFARRPFEMKVLRGTEITLDVRTNRTVKEAALVLQSPDGKTERLVAEKVPDDPNAFKVKVLVERSGRYHLEYTTPEGDGYTDPNPPELVALIDNPPHKMDLTSPDHDTQLPCNGLLQVEGAAADDFGVAGIALCMREVTQNFVFKDKPYRGDKPDSLKLPSGGYMQQAAYKDFVDLNTVHTVDGKLLALQPNMVLEYWLEARDACDYPQPNGPKESKHYRVTLLAPEKDEGKLKEQREQASKDQREHEKKQDEALRNEEKKRFDEEKQRKDQAKNEQDSTDSGGGSNPEKANPDNKNGPGGNQPDNEVDSRAEKLKRAIEQNEKEKEQKSAGKGGPQPEHAQAKDGGAGEQKPQPSEAKSGGNPDNGQKPSENKPGDPMSNPMTPPGEAKPEGGKPDSGNTKPNTSPPNAQPNSEGKDKPAPQPDQKPAQSKGAPQHKNEAAESKPETQPNAECSKADCKNDGRTTKPDAQNSKPKPEPSPAPNASEGKNEGPNNRGNDPKAQEKPGGSPLSGDAKPAPTEMDEVPRAEAKKAGPSGSGPRDPRQATPEDVKETAKNLKSDDEQERKDAAKKLEEIADKARDREAREQAKEELENAELKPPTAGKAKSGDQGSSGAAKAMQGDPKDAGQAKAGKGTPEKSSEAKDLGKPPLVDKLPQMDDADKEQLEQRQKAYLNKLKEDLQRSGKFNQKDWDDFLQKAKEHLDPPPLTESRNTNAEAPEAKKGERREPKASMLQLREFIKAVDPKVLKDAGMTPEQWRTFLEQYAERARVEEQANKETLPPPMTASPLPGNGGVREKPDVKQDPNAPSSGSRSQPPPSYRDAYKRLTGDKD